MTNDDEIQRRRDAARFATVDARLSGYILDKALRDDIEQFVIGEITTAQMRENVLARYDLKKN